MSVFQMVPMGSISRLPGTPSKAAIRWMSDQKEGEMKVPLLMGALCGIFYQNSAIAKDQDGIVMFGGGNLGCAKILFGSNKK